MGVNSLWILAFHTAKRPSKVLYCLLVAWRTHGSYANSPRGWVQKWKTSRGMCTQMENRAHKVCAFSYLWPLRLKIPLFFSSFLSKPASWGNQICPEEIILLSIESLVAENFPQGSREGYTASCGYRAYSSGMRAFLRDAGTLNASPQAKAECALSWTDWNSIKQWNEILSWVLWGCQEEGLPLCSRHRYTFRRDQQTALSL